MRNGLTIGEFARLTRLSVRTLRRYHEAGLLAPASVDDATGYRYYSREQIPDAQVIHRLRELDVPLAEVHRILGSADPSARADLIAGHLRRLEDRLDRTRAAVVSLRQLLKPDVEELAVQLRSVPARTVAAIEATVDLDDVLGWYHAAMSELDTAVAGREGFTPPGGLYDNELFTLGRGRALVYRPVPGAPTVGRVAPKQLPAVELAVAVHPGDHDDIDVTYGRLGGWVVEHALAVAGPVHETYVRGPRDDPDPRSWRTEIGWPVFRVSQA
ncbi:MerR family transcriptional regulator [Amycolatopsis rhabdoformis]|uniref:MerR family transcriptional regulator n=1 Tax=Amycolatopsis rhabdoformis TaxID=1448059 RepID=A0ABZ1IMD7_9PSEU|nr:MerR family transcriptional regulator [Amycolatopsis rhabdoformis]WSE34615.1 MerR family transcriptional regulator [Amycolatopsis rhabdoformis]